MKPFFGYIRVSTVKQGQQSVSLPQQKDAILAYARRQGFEIISWFEEQQTAAKRGRSIFNRMLKLLRQGKARGVVLHKIDRGARNLKDWSDLAELSDAGLEVHFANESLDLRSRGGRLSADIQAVVAADYIRNLREETLKGFYGRLKQGIYPLGAPIGYLDKGGGKVKEPDPVKAPFVRKAFELYATGNYNLNRLGEELFRLGLRNKEGARLTQTGLSVMLNNPFYFGLIVLKKTGEMFEGKHPPIVPKNLFDRVQKVLCGKTNARVKVHDLLFRRLLTCEYCGYSLIGEVQKGHHYYRCHTKRCQTKGIREEAADAVIRQALAKLVLSDEERSYFVRKILSIKTNWGKRQRDERNALKLGLEQIDIRLRRLLDAFLDGAIERAIFEGRKAQLLLERKQHEESLANLPEAQETFPQRLTEFLELAGRALLSYEMALADEKRDLLKILTSNRRVTGKNIVVKLSFPFSEVANRSENSCSPLHRDIPRTWDRLLDVLTTAYTRGQLPDLKRTSICDEGSDDDTDINPATKRSPFAGFGKN